MATDPMEDWNDDQEDLALEEALTYQRALKLQAAGPDEYPFGYYFALAEREKPRDPELAAELLRLTDETYDRLVNGDPPDLDLDSLEEPEPTTIVQMRKEDFDLLLAPQPFDTPYIVYGIDGNNAEQRVTSLFSKFSHFHNLFWPRLPMGSTRLRVSPQTHQDLSAAATRLVKSDPLDGSMFAIGIPVDKDDRMPDTEIHFTFEH